MPKIAKKIANKFEMRLPKILCFHRKITPKSKKKIRTNAAKGRV